MTAEPCWKAWLSNKMRNALPLSNTHHRKVAFMHPQTLKQEVIESLQHLPDDADIDEIMYRLYVIDKVRKSRAAVENGDVISHEDLKREIQQW